MLSYRLKIIKMSTVNDILQDQIIHHSAVDLMRIEASERRKVLRMLRDLERDLVSDLATIDPTAPKRTTHQTKRLQALLKQTQDTIKTHMDKVSSIIDTDLINLAAAETAFVAGAMNAALGAEVVSVAMSPSRLRVLARKTLVEGAYPSQWWKKQTQAIQDKFAREMRMGMQRSETIGELSRRIRKNVMPVSRRNAEALVRTSVMAVLNESRRESYAQMGDLIKGYKYVATLDSRTTPYCRAADGTVFRKNYKVAKGPVWVTPPPNHWQCRSVLSPITKSWAELRAQYKGSKKMDKLEPIPPKTRASMDGKVPKDWNYTEWLKNRPKSMQNDILGPKRADLFRAGKIKSMVQLLDQHGNFLTIKELLKAIKNGTLVDPITGRIIQ